MKVIFAIGIVLMIIRGVWLIPSSREEAIDPQAPYRCVRGVLWLILGFIGWVGLMS